MKTNYHNLTGNKARLSVMEACNALEAAISEGVAGDFTSIIKENNLYGRPVISSGSGSLTFSSGLSATGLRTGTFLQNKQLDHNSTQLDQAVRQHLALVVIGIYRTHQQMHHLADTGAFQLWASNPQEALDFLLIAHRISELSLVPGIVGIDQTLIGEDAEISFPDGPLILGFLGNPDTRIACPTPAQEMIFGKTRRRVPNWYNPDVPVLNGAQKNVQDLGFEAAANQQFFNDHLNEIIHQVFDEFKGLTGRDHRPVEWIEAPRGDYTIISSGTIKHEVAESLDHQRKKINGLHLNQVYPFPADEIAEYCNKSKAITILEQCTGNTDSAPLFKEVSGINALKTQRKLSARYGENPTSKAVQAVIDNMLSGESAKNKYWLDIPLTLDHSIFPKHQILLQSIAREYPESTNKFIQSHPAHSRQQPTNNGRLASVVKKFKDHGPAYSRLTRFYDDTAALYEDEPNELVADPSKAIPVMPPDTAGFMKMNRETIPVFDPQSCTGCGDCFIACPHSAIPPVALNLESIIQSGMEIAKGNGHKITQLTPMVKNLAKFAHKEIRERKSEIVSSRDFLPQAFQKLSTQLKLEGEKLNAAQNDFDAVIIAIGEMPASITDTFYNRPDQLDKDSGEVFSLAIDPSACTGCGICAEVCEPDALKMLPQNDELISKVNNQFTLHELLPDTSGDTINRLVEDSINPADERITGQSSHYNPFAALMLSKSYYQSLTGGSKDETGSSQKAMMHLLLTSAESAFQPRVDKAVKSIKELLDGLAQNIQMQLGNALPKQDFETLSEVLQETSEERLSFEQMIERWDAKEQLAFIDRSALQRKVNLTQSLKDLLWSLQEGPTGTGRSRHGLALDESFEWANQYPWNHFAIPVVSWNGSSGELAKGLVQGQIRHLLDNIKLIRRASLEIKNRYDSNIHDKEIASITWKDLTPEERNMIPPVLLAGKRANLTESMLASLLDILNSDWPVKILVLDDAVPPVDRASSFINTSVSAILPAITLNKAFVLKSSLADPVHLFGGIQQGLQQNGPAFMWVLAPDHKKHTLPLQKWTKLNGLAWNSRAFNHLKFYPSPEEKFISSKIDLDANPAHQDQWIQHELKYMEDEKEQSITYKMTMADWLYTILRWETHFRPYHQAMGEAILLANYLELDENSRAGKVPVICRVDSEGALNRYSVSEYVVAATSATLDSWNVLREMAGELTEFPEKLHKQVEQELAEKYEAEKDELKADYEKQINELEQVHLEKIRQKLKEKLMALSRNGA